MNDSVTQVTCANGHALDEPPDTPADERQPCPVCGSNARTFHASITAGVRVTTKVKAIRVPAAEVPADQTSQADEVRGHYRATLDWTRLEETWMVQVLNVRGELVEGGIGDSPEEALLEVYERLIPPSSE